MSSYLSICNLIGYTYRVLYENRINGTMKAKHCISFESFLQLCQRQKQKQKHKLRILKRSDFPCAHVSDNIYMRLELQTHQRQNTSLGVYSRLSRIRFRSYSNAVCELLLCCRHMSETREKVLNILFDVANIHHFTSLSHHSIPFILLLHFQCFKTMSV